MFRHNTDLERVIGKWTLLKGQYSSTETLSNLLEELLPLYWLIIVGPEAEAQWFGIIICFFFFSSSSFFWDVEVAVRIVALFLFIFIFIQIYASAPVFRRVTLSLSYYSWVKSLWRSATFRSRLSRLTVLMSHLILTVPSFLSFFLIFFLSTEVAYWQCYLAVAWLVPRETATVSAQVLCAPFNQAPVYSVISFEAT